MVCFRAGGGPGAQCRGAGVRTALCDPEVRSYQSEQVNALWHLDFHHGKVRVLLPDGQWGYPLLLGVLDDRSRLCCHLQWYLSEGAEELCHGLTQALLKRSLPRSLLSDNGSAMLATETTQGWRGSALSTKRRCLLHPIKMVNRKIFGPKLKAGSCRCSKAWPTCRCGS